MSDNPAYAVHEVDATTFGEKVLGIVVALVKVLGHGRMGIPS